jgi:membrane-associated phospholipid phosphatase
LSPLVIAAWLATAADGSAARPPADGTRTIAGLPANLVRGAAAFWSGASAAPLVAGGTATAAATYVDEPVRDAIAAPGGPLGKGGQVAGGAAVTFSVATGLLALGRLSDDPGRRAASYDLFCATLVSQAYTHALKLVVSRERPNGDGDSFNSSFPSGHASNAFAWATVLERHYGRKAAVPGYAFAALVGASRLRENKHWLSDVVGGAALGFVAARAVVRANGGKLKAGGSAADPGRGLVLRLAPIAGRRTVGVRLAGAF